MSNSTKALSVKPIVYAVEDTTAGTIVFPSQDTKAIIWTGYSTTTQGIIKMVSVDYRTWIQTT